MTKIIINFVILLFSISAFAQNHPTGQIIVKDTKTNALYKNIKRLQIQTSLKAIGTNYSDSDITFIDNSKNDFFPPIIDQIGGSCAYASGVGYIYNYEYNALNNLNGKDLNNVVNYLQVYAFLNNGEDKGGHCPLGWSFLRNNGSPTMISGGTSNVFEWATGFDEYYGGMERGLVDYKRFVSDKDGDIEKMKQYLIDHGDGSTHGGLIQFSAWAHPLDPVKYSGPKSTGYDAMIHHFGNSGMHSMTICGFDDTVVYDYSGDGKIQDNEKGAFICVNSWGETWGDAQGCDSDGRFYAPYYAFSTLIQSTKNVSRTKSNMGGGTGNGGKDCLVVIPKKSERLLVFKAKLTYTSRNDLQIVIGVANTPNATSPEKKISLNFMKHQGADMYMRGNNYSTYKRIELGINASALLPFITSDNPTFFFRIKTRTIGNTGVGKILSCSLLDYRNNPTSPKEIVGTFNRVELKNGTSCTAMMRGEKIIVPPVEPPVIEEGVNTSVKCVINNDKTAEIIFNSVSNINAALDIIKDGNVIKNLISKEINAGVVRENLDFKDLRAGSYYIRIVVGNRFIYRTLNL